MLKNRRNSINLIQLVSNIKYCPSQGCTISVKRNCNINLNIAMTFVGYPPFSATKMWYFVMPRAIFTTMQGVNALHLMCSISPIACTLKSFCDWNSYWIYCTALFRSAKNFSAVWNRLYWILSNWEQNSITFHFSCFYIWLPLFKVILLKHIYLISIILHETAFLSYKKTCRFD